MKSDSRSLIKKDQLGHVQLAVVAYVDDLVISGGDQMVKEFISMILEELTLKHVHFLTLENPVEFLGRTIKKLKNGNMTMEFSQKFIDELLKIFEVMGKVTTTGLKLQTLPEDQKAQRDNVIHQSSGQLLENFFGWFSSGTTLSIRSKNSQARSSTRKIRTSKISSICSSMSNRQGASSSSWSLSFRSGIRKANFRFRLSAIQIQIGQVVKNQGSQRVVHKFQCSMSTFNQQAELRFQLLILQPKVNSMQ